MASVGRPLPGEGLAIIDGDDQLLPPGEPGEVVALSRFAMEGYWRRPDVTADMIWTDGIGRHWLRSGDIGRIDPDGYLTITDRKKDMIISGGQNIYPADIEAVILAHPAVSDCAVIGVPSEKWGETPLAIVVARGGMTLDDATLLAWTNERLGRQQKASAVELRSEIPRNPNGKVLKRELRAAYWPGRET
jgi:long-chain acyl-CoA synthetase